MVISLRQKQGTRHLVQQQFILVSSRRISIKKERTKCCRENGGPMAFKNKNKKKKNQSKKHQQKNKKCREGFNYKHRKLKHQKISKKQEMLSCYFLLGVNSSICIPRHPSCHAPIFRGKLSFATSLLLGGYTRRRVGFARFFSR
jgi:hypothetical protein